MMKYINTAVFNVKCDAIVNTINCVGFMGKGLAYEFSLRYPKLLKEYKTLCKEGKINVGKMYYHFADDVIIVNFPTKMHYKYPSKIEWIEDGLKDFVATYKQFNIKSIAFPYLGCANGRLEFEIVKKLMEKYLSDLDIDVYICSNVTSEPEGKELEMLNSFKNTNIYSLKDKIKLKEKQLDVLMEAQPNIKRFYEISKLDGIGKGSYEKIYRYFYNKPNEVLWNEQLTFF